MTSTDDCFPRGGFKPTVSADPNVKKPQRQENLFGNVPHTKKAKGKKKRQNGQNDKETTSVPDFVSKTEGLTAVSADTLSYKKIHEGMTVLACVERLNTMTVKVELPGRCFAEILVQSISTTYTKLVSEAVKSEEADLPALSDVIQVGNFLPVKIIQIDNGDKLRIFASCNPADVNQQFKHADFTKNMLVWGCIKEKSDHGYLIDMGVKNCRAHLSFDAIDEGKEYHPGRVLYMTVSKSVTSKEATTLTLSAKKSAFEKTVESMGTSLDKVLPGMQVEFLVQKILKDGLQGQYFDECSGFINDLYLKKQFDNVKKYKEFTSVKARLLYVHPVSKLGYFTLKSLDEAIPENKLSVGAWLAGTVVGKAGTGLVVKLEGGFKGFITYKRLLQSIKTTEKEREDLASLIANKFPAGTTKHCTVLDYNHTERLYICTFEQITELMNIQQLQLGQTVKGRIKTINHYGLVVRIGKLEAFAPNDNLSNVRFSENIKKQFKVGQEVTGKIWNLNIGKNDIILTLKPDLVASNIHLTSYQGVSHFEQYPGVVIATNDTGVLILFYGGVKGWLPSRNIPQLENKDARNVFYRGQIVKALVVRNDDEKLTLTLMPLAKKRVQVGCIIVKPKISKVTDDGLHFMIAEDIEAFLPKEQLAVEGLGKLYLPTYTVNQVLDEELMCVIAGTPPVFSVREYVVHKREFLRIPGLAELVRPVVMRAIYKGNKLLGIPLKLHSGEFEGEERALLKVPKYESVCAKVEKRMGKGLIQWTTQLSKVFNYSHHETLKYLDQYLQDIERLRSRYRQTGNALGNLDVGATVDCVIDKIDLHRGCSVVVLPMNCQGLVSLNHCPDNLVPGSKVQGKVLWVNYEMNYVAITLHPTVMGKIADTQDGKVDMSLLSLKNQKVRILHANSHVAVGVLCGKLNRLLVYLPVKLHENDFTPKVDFYDALVGKEVKVMSHRMKSGRLLAVTSDMAATMTKQRKRCERIAFLRNKKLVERAAKKEKQSIKSDIKEEEEDKEDEGIESAEDIKSENESIKSEADSDDAESPMEAEEEEEDAEEDENEVEEEEEDAEEDEKEAEEDEKEVGEEESTKKKKKRKLTDEEPPQPKEKKKKTEIESKVKQNKKATVVLPGMSSFFEEETPVQVKQESDDEEVVTAQKKKLTPAERLQQAKVEEARLRKIETELADASLLPQNAEQYDRALLGNPDDSELWTRYIAFHAQSTEFEKARAVAKRAIERISYTALQDRLNVWLAYLNLENMYGTKDSFNSVFEEAARCNDTLTIFLEAIKMLAEMSKFAEMEERVKKARGKFKQELQMWLEIGKVYYKCGRFAEARKLKDSALLTLTDKKSHMQLIVQYAIMEFTLGESNQGEALFETILQADPKRVDIWCTYVDQLIKKDKIDLARNVMTRAVGQKLAYKKMRTLFKKYHTFETTYGDDETIAHVTNLLREYSDQ